VAAELVAELAEGDPQLFVGGQLRRRCQRLQQQTRQGGIAGLHQRPPEGPPVVKIPGREQDPELPFRLIAVAAQHRKLRARAGQFTRLRAERLPARDQRRHGLLVLQGEIQFQRALRDLGVVRKRRSIRIIGGGRLGIIVLECEFRGQRQRRGILRGLVGQLQSGQRLLRPRGRLAL